MSKPLRTNTTRTGLSIALDEEYLRLLQALQNRPEYANHSLEAIAAATVYRRAVELGVDGAKEGGINNA